MTLCIVRVLAVLALLILVGGCTVVAPVAAPKAPAANIAETVKGNNAFALDLYGKLRGQEGNLFLSPASISTALAMTYAGARGTTADEMAQALRFTLGQERLHPAMGALLHDLNAEGQNRGYRLSVANALWAQKGYPFLPEFVQVNKDNYGAGLNEVDYRRDTEGVRKTINGWVEQQTQDRIKELLRPGILDERTRLVLTNAIYFKGNWDVQFKKERTQEAPFQVTTENKVTVPLMSQTGEFNHFEGDTFQALELPYAGQDLSMVVFLPKKVDGLADFEKTLTADQLTNWLGKLRPAEVDVALPRFKVSAEFSLKDALAALGMHRAFSATKADFSGMDGKKNLFLSAVIHKAVVEVNEEGTEAAAATGMVMQATSARRNPVFRADHPFVFLIRDRRAGSILFLGRLVNPQR